METSRSLADDIIEARDWVVMLRADAEKAEQKEINDDRPWGHTIRHVEWRSPPGEGGVQQ